MTCNQKVSLDGHQVGQNVRKAWNWSRRDLKRPKLSTAFRTEHFCELMRGKNYRVFRAEHRSASAPPCGGCFATCVPCGTFGVFCTRIHYLHKLLRCFAM